MDTRPSSPEIVKSPALHEESATHVSTYCGTRDETPEEKLAEIVALST